MTRDEAARKASDWAMEDQNYPDKDNIDQESYEVAVRAYMMCYKHMTKGGPNGWIVERLENDKECGIQSFYFSEQHAKDELFRETHGYMKHGESWRMFPVIVIPMQEPEK